MASPESGFLFTSPPLQSFQSQSSQGHSDDEGGIYSDNTSRSRSLSSSSASAAGSSTSPSSTTTSNKFLLPIPTPSTNRSQSSFALSEIGIGSGGSVSGVGADGDPLALEDLPAEIAEADMSIAADGSFVETTSGPAARELKRRYDRLYGVNKDMRSPYIITAMINQHGKQVFRVGLRAQTEQQPIQPDYDFLYHNNNSINGAADTPNTSSSTSSSTPTQSQTQIPNQNKRRSRLSGLLLAPGNANKSLFSSSSQGANSVYGYTSTINNNNTYNPNFSTSTPANNLSIDVNLDINKNKTQTKKSFSPPRILRKTHSIPELSYSYSSAGMGEQYQSQHQYQYPPPQGSQGLNGMHTPTPIPMPTGRTHSHSVTAADLSRFDIPANPSSNSAASAGKERIYNNVPINVSRNRNRGDVFSRVLGWAPTSSSSGSNHYAQRHDASVHSSNASTTTTTNTASTRSIISEYDSNVDKDKDKSKDTIVKYPFGRGMIFDSPSPYPFPYPGRNKGDKLSSSPELDESHAPCLNPSPSTDAIFEGVRIIGDLEKNSDYANVNDKDVNASLFSSALDPNNLDLGTSLFSGLGAKTHPILLSPVQSPVVREMRSFESADTARQIRVQFPSANATTSNSTSNATNLSSLSNSSNASNLTSNSSSSTTLDTTLDTLANLIHSSSGPGTGTASRRDTVESYLSTDSTISNASDLSYDSASGRSLRSVKSAIRVGVGAESESEIRGRLLQLRGRKEKYDENQPRSHRQSQSQSQNQAYGPNYHTSGFTRYQTGVFDVLQHYRGLPVLESLSLANGVGVDSPSLSFLGNVNQNREASGLGNSRSDTDVDLAVIGPPTIKMSLRSVDEPTPLDDPRFVIWGETEAPIRVAAAKADENVEMDGGGISIGGGEDVNNGVVRKRSVKDRDKPTGENLHVNISTLPSSSSNFNSTSTDFTSGLTTTTAPNVDPDDTTTPKRILLAATIERWIAQLTSQLDHDELLTFFLTYRTYITPLDLCQLLIARFHWSLQVSDSISPEDALCKRLARVRTSTAMRFWLITFFRVDFLYDRPLRVLFGNWINAIWKDAILQKLPDALLIVKKIRKVVKECKEAHVSRSRYGRKNSVPASHLPPRPSRNIDEVIDISIEAMASLPPPPPPPASLTAAIKKTNIKADGEDSDVDLDFDPEESLALLDSPGVSGFSTFLNQASSANYNLNGISAAFNANAIQNPNNPSLSSASAARIMLQQPLHLTILQHARIGTSDADADARLSARPRVIPAPLPVHNHSTLSRVVVNTIGKLGRWRRVLSSRGLGAGAGGNHGQHGHSPSFNGFGFGEPRVVDDDGYSYGGGSGVGFGDGGTDARNASVSALDLELNATGDLLNVRGGVEKYLKAIEPIGPFTAVTGDNDGVEMENDKSASVQVSTNSNSPPSYTAIVAALEAVDSSTPAITVEEAETNVEGNVPIGVAIDIADVDSTNIESNDVLVGQNTLKDSPSTQEGSTPSTPLDEAKLSVDATGIVPPRAASAASMRSQRSWHPAIVSIDDLDSDETSSDEGANLSGPPGLKMPTRRLPLRKDFEFLRRSMDSVSSLSIMTRPSLIAHQSISEQSSDTSSVSSHRGLGDGLQQWQVDALINELSDDDDVPGDVEAALQRLEGQINPQKQRAKERKVDGWVKTIQEKMAKGDLGDQLPTFPDVDSDDDYGTDAHSRDFDGNYETPFMMQQETVSNANADPDTVDSESISQEAITPTPQQVTHVVVEANSAANADPVVTSTSVLTQNPTSATEERQSADQLSSTSIEASSHEHPQAQARPPPVTQMLQHTIPTNGLPTIIPTNPNLQKINAASVRQDIANFITLGSPSVYRSFILGYRSENIAQHFGMIDREIFLAIKPQEVVSEDWMTPSEDTNVLDWNQYIWDNRKRSAIASLNGGSGGKGKMSALVAARARFNLLAKFTASEVVLSHPHERIPVVNKFIRIAWKAYLQNNFATLVAIIAGLNSEWVRRALGRSRGHIGIWEKRVLEDLKTFASSDDDFLYIRQAIAAISDAETLSGVVADDMINSIGAADGLSTVSGGVGGRGNRPAAPATCIPFFGVYLSQLHRLSKLPDLIDPSEPTKRVETDPVTGNFTSLAHPEVFATLRPLPPFMQLEPLINVQKQRLIASVIRSLVTGQHIANKVSFPMDKKLFQRCLKLRAVDFDALQTVT